VQMRISNRKIYTGVLSANGIKTQEQQAEVFRVIDKIEKLQPSEFNKLLVDVLKPYEGEYQKPIEDVQAILDYQNKLKSMTRSAQIAFLESLLIALENKEWLDFEKKHSLKKIHYFDHDFIQGFADLYSVLNWLSHLPEDAVVADLSIVRGLDYYTGTVYETQLLDVPEFEGSVCSGGRYDDLAGSFINKHLPGVGISIGFSRLFDVIRQSRPDLLNIGAKSPTDILVYTEDKDLTSEATKAAQILRERGLNVETYHTVKKWDKHFKYAEKKAIPHIMYVKAANEFEVKTLASGESQETSPQSWTAQE